MERLRAMEPQLIKRRSGQRNLFVTFLDNGVLLLGLAFIAWILELVDWMLRTSSPDGSFTLDRFGILPRNPHSLVGIVTSHWLHGGFTHLVSNTVPFIILGGFVLLGGRALFWKVSFLVSLLGGAALWCCGGPGNHLGASLVIFGYLGFLLTRGIFEKSALWISIAVITLVLYGGMIFGVLPSQDGVSWEGHLFGFFSGILAAKLLVPKNRPIYQFNHGRST